MNSATRKPTRYERARQRRMIEVGEHRWLRKPTVSEAFTELVAAIADGIESLLRRGKNEGA